MPAIRSLSSLLQLAAMLLVLTSALGAEAAEDENKVGMVTKVEHDGAIVSGEAQTRATIGTPVHMKDELRTGPNGRLQVTFRDDSVLTLGEQASIVIDRYVYDPKQSVGETVLDATKGAFRFASGHLKDLKQESIAVSTPFADISVRGTEFWGGPIDQNFGVLLLKGKISVSNQAGSVVLSSAGQGSDIASPLGAPGPPKRWPKEKVARAIATVALH